MNIYIKDFYGRDYSISNIPNDSTWKELEETFKKLGLMIGFPPSILNNDEGEWSYKEIS